jgi:hypothetical protein
MLPGGRWVVGQFHSGRDPGWKMDGAQAHIAAMSRLRISLATAALLVSIGVAQSQVLKNEPAAGNLPLGKKVLVDDGACPAGQIKQVTGGSNTQQIARSTTCVPRGKK